MKIPSHQNFLFFLFYVPYQVMTQEKKNWKHFIPSKCSLNLYVYNFGNRLLYIHQVIFSGPLFSISSSKCPYLICTLFQYIIYDFRTDRLYKFNPFSKICDLLTPVVSPSSYFTVEILNHEKEKKNTDSNIVFIPFYIYSQSDARLWHRNT